MDSSSANAIAGPSSPRPSPRPASPQADRRDDLTLFLPPPAPSSASVPLTSTQDLLGKFHLLGAYDKYVRPYAIASAVDVKPHLPSQPPVGSPDKGKGREVAAQNNGSRTPVADQGDDGDDDDGNGKGDKNKMKNNYKHLVKNAPGKHSLKKDDYLTTMIQVPPKQRMKIVPFDQKTQRDAFLVSLEGLKGWNYNTLILETAQAREDRKKRKELKRLAKLQQQAHAAAAAAAASTPISQSPSIQAPIPQLATSRPGTPGRITVSTPRPTGVGTPRPAMPGSRPSSVKPILGVSTQVPPASQRVGTPLRTGTPTGPHPLSAPPLSATSLPTATSLAQQQQQQQRGKKRERDEGNPVGLTNGNGNGNWNSSGPSPTPIPTAIIGAKPGIGNARPRPIKKQRMDMQGQSRDSIPVQQPTPQGV
ncbi:hypothetical protein C8J56DRAFT_930631 [Mycena floridula]|nr:hypothetical protein C8J56DRAFT_930631 [Mycena floridula]